MIERRKNESELKKRKTHKKIKKVRILSKEKTLHKRKKMRKLRRENKRNFFLKKMERIIDYCFKFTSYLLPVFFCVSSSRFFRVFCLVLFSCLFSCIFSCCFCFALFFLSINWPTHLFCFSTIRLFSSATI